MAAIINLSDRDVRTDPAPHFVREDVIEPSLFSALRASFPDEDSFNTGENFHLAGGRSDIEFGMAAYDALVRRHDCWAGFLSHIRSKDYAEFLLDLFGPHLAPHGNLVRRTGYRYVDTSEFQLRQRPDRHLPPLIGPLARRVRIGGRGLDRILHVASQRIQGLFFPDGYYMICTICRAWGGYVQPPHLDTPDRKIVTLFYFNDPVEEGGGRGGEFVLFRPKPMLRQRGVWADPETVETLQVVAPKANLGVGLLNCPAIFHSAEPFEAGSEPRRFMYVTLAKL